MYFEDLQVGAEFVSQGRTVTEADIVAFAGISGDFNRLHTDETWVTANTGFRGRIAHGLLVTSIVSGLPTPGLDELEIIAYLEVTRKMREPVYPCDTIHARNTVTEVRPRRSSDDSGIVAVEVTVLNQDGTAVHQGTDVILVARDPVKREDGPR